MKMSISRVIANILENPTLHEYLKRETYHD